MIKELIQHISEEDLEVNITFEIGASNQEIRQELKEIKQLLKGETENGGLTESDKEELRNLVDEVQEPDVVGPGQPDPVPDDLDEIREAIEELREAVGEGAIQKAKSEETDVAKKDFAYTDFSSEDDEMSEETEDTIENELREDLKEQLTEEKRQELEEEGFSEEDIEEMREKGGTEDAEEDAEETDGEFDEVFGTGEEEEEEPDSPPEDEPSEEERDEAGADFEELFG